MSRDALIRIDGSRGEGGGQILRSSLGLSLVTGRSVLIENIRKGRKKPGLRRQHLTAVLAAREISGGAVEGASIGSGTLVFSPGAVRPGTYSFDVGTAGSTTLVLQAILPALLTAEGEFELRFEGGTHNPFAPPFDFLARVYLPLVERLGPGLAAGLVRPGFYPAGGGCLTLRVTPAPRLGPLELLERGKLIERRVRAIVSGLPRHIAERECQTIRKKTGWDRKCFSIETVEDARGPGNVVLIELRHQNVTEVFTGFGQPGVRAEQVASAALREAREYLEADVPVGRHLADQLVLPLGIGAWQGEGGGRFRTLSLTPHTTTHIDVLRAFLDVGIAVDERAKNDVLVDVRPTKST